MFYFALIFFIFGVALRSVWVFDLFVLFAGFLAALVLWFFTKHRLFLYITLSVFFLFLGAARFELMEKAQNIDSQNHISRFTQLMVALTATVFKEPEVKETNTQYVLSDIYIDNQRVYGRAILFHSLYPRYEIGDRLSITCELKKPEPFEDFAYDSYLERKNIFALCFYPKKVAFIPHNNPTIWMQFQKKVLKVKRVFLKRLKRLLPAPESYLLSGLLIGDTTGMPSELKSAFINTGTIHIVAISGYNISIIIKLFLNMAPFLLLYRKHAWFFIVPVLVSFVVITGAQASVVRAAIMGLIAGMAGIAGRISDVGRTLALAGALMVAWSPYALYDIGFQLSFFATLGLVYISPKLEKAWSRWIPSEGAVMKIMRESGSTTLGANIAVAPLLIYHFGRLSLIAPVANILILWTIPLVMLLGFASVILSFIAYPLGQAIAWFCYVLLKYIIEFVDVLG